MTLNELISELEKRDPEKTIKNGFGEGMSYRGYYQDAAFEPSKNTTFGEMLIEARDLLNTYQDGYKGGEYLISGYVEAYIASYGFTGEPITSFNFKYWDNQ